jgi:hypothetical protein
VGGKTQRPPGLAENHAVYCWGLASFGGEAGSYRANKGGDSRREQGQKLFFAEWADEEVEARNV